MFEKEHAQEFADHEAEVEHCRDRIREFEGLNAAFGKSIEFFND